MQRALVPALGAALALVLASATDCPAHDMKVMARQLVVAPGDEDTVYISFGHTLGGNNPIDAETLENYQVHSPSGSVLPLHAEGTSDQANEIHVDEPGVYQAVATRQPAVFTEVIDAAGNHIHHRGPKSSVTEGTAGVATMSHQYSKALLISDQQADAPEPIGHELEIVPEGNPSTWQNGQDLRFQVLFRGLPIPGADLVATYDGFQPDGAWCYATATDRQGLATVRPECPGTWILRARLQRPAPEGLREEFDLESYTATLTLQVAP